MCEPDLFIHLEQLSIAAHPSTAFRFTERTKSKGGEVGDEALCRAWRDCKQAVKQVQAPPLIPKEDFGRVDTGRILGGVLELGK